MAATSQSSCPEPRLIGLTSCHSDLGSPELLPTGGKSFKWGRWGGGAQSGLRTHLTSQRHTGGQLLTTGCTEVSDPCCQQLPSPQISLQVDTPAPDTSAALSRPQDVTQASPQAVSNMWQVQPKVPSLKGSSPTSTLLYRSNSLSTTI